MLVIVLVTLQYFHCFPWLKIFLIENFYLGSLFGCIMWYDLLVYINQIFSRSWQTCHYLNGKAIPALTLQTTHPPFNEPFPWTNFASKNAPFFDSIIKYSSKGIPYFSYSVLLKKTLFVLQLVRKKFSLTNFSLSLWCNLSAKQAAWPTRPSSDI